MPLLLVQLALAFASGYWAGARFGRGKALAATLQKEASALLESVGKLSVTGALQKTDYLELKQGNTQDGMQLLIKTTKGPKRDATST
jgi:hypothetical protein